MQMFYNWLKQVSWTYSEFTLSKSLKYGSKRQFNNNVWNPAAQAEEETSHSMVEVSEEYYARQEFSRKSH